MIFDRNYRDIRRTRKVFKALQLPETGKIIDVSCGGGRLLKTIENSNATLELVGVDITPGFLATHPELSHITFVTAEASALPYPDAYFDVAICSMSMHHYKNLAAVLSEMNRVVKNGGQIYLIDMLLQSKWAQYLYNLKGCGEPYHFEKFYTVSEIESLIVPLGFQIQKTYSISHISQVRMLHIQKKRGS